MFTAASIGSWLAVFQPLLTAFLNAFGRTVNDFLASQRANQNAKDLGAAEAKVDHQNAVIEAQQDMLDAQANAPRTIDDVIARFEEGSA